MKKIILTTILLAIYMNLFSQTQNPYIPLYRQGLWREAGLEFDSIIEVNELINVQDFTYNAIHYSAAANGEEDDTSIIQNAIDKADDNSGFNIVYFPTGTYKITNSLNVPSEVTLKGAGSDLSILYFHVADDINCIKIYNKTKTGIEDLKIQRYGIGEDSGKTIVISSSDNCWVKGVESKQASGHHILITNNSTHIDIHGCYIHHAKDYGGGGHGYGVWITHNSSLCLIENNIIRHLRHSMIVADGAFGNVFGYNYSDDIQDSGFWDLGDISLHGHYSTDIGPFKNLFEGNNCWYIDVDDQWGVNGNYNTFLRNRSIENGIKVVEGNDNCNIINNYFRNCSHYSFPWLVYGDNHIAENNRVNFYGTIVWLLNQNPGYWQIESFYGDYNYDPIEEINEANYRYHNSATKTVYCGYWQYSLPSVATGVINLSGGSGNLKECRAIFRKLEYSNGEYILTDKFYGTTNSDGEYVINLVSGHAYRITFEHLSGEYENEIIDNIYISQGTNNIDQVTLQYNPDKYVIVPYDYNTIQEGLDHIQDGGTVVVMNGTYQGANNRNLTWSDKHITLRAQSLNNPENCIIDGNSSGDHAFYLTDSQINNDDQIFGFTIKNFDGAYYNNGAVCFKNLASPLISNCIIEDCSLNNPDDLDHYGLGVAVYCEGNTVIENCVIRNNEGWDAEGGAAIACKGNVTIRNNEIYGNSLYTYLNGAPHPDVDRQGLAIYIVADESDSPTIHNNEIYNNIDNTTATEEGSLIYTEFDVSWNNNEDPIEITNNTIYNNETKELIYLTDNAEITICNNLIYENTCYYYCSAITIAHYSSYSSSDSYTIDNNTIVDNDCYAGIHLCDSGYYNGIYNNIIAFNEGYGIHWNTGTEQLIVGYSNLYENDYGNYDSPPSQEIYCLDCDPVFTDRVNYDYTLKWNASGFSPCIDTGHPYEQYNDADGTPADMGAIPVASHDYFKDDYDDEEFDNVDWISFPVLNTTTTGWTNAIKVLERQLLIDDDYQTEDSLDYILYDNREVIYFSNNTWINELLPDGEFDSKQGYKFQLKEGCDYMPVQGISGTWQDESTPVTLLANDQENWIGCFLEEPAAFIDAFESISNKWSAIYSEHWAVERPEPGTTPEIVFELTVNPGELYIIKVYEQCQLVWNESSPPVPPKTKEMTDYFTYKETVDYMAITIDTVYSDSSIAEIAVFSDDKCIGASKVYDDEYPVQILAYTPETLKNGNNGLEFKLYYEGQKGESTKSIPYVSYSKEVHAYIDKPLNYERKSFVTVKLNTDESSSIIHKLTLLQNYPNPVRTNMTTIKFMPEQDAAHTELNIYNIRDQLVRSIDCDGIISSGTKGVYYSISWDCRDRYGNDVKNGIYFYKLISGEKSAVHKMLLMK